MRSFAWYKATGSNAHASNNASYSLETSTSAPELGGITLVMAVSSSDKVKLSDDTDGKSYYFSAGNIKTEASSVTYDELFGTATVSVSKIVLTSEWEGATTDDAKEALVGLDAGVLKGYAGTYNMKLTVNDQARIGTTLPGNFNGVAALTTTAVDFTVTISNEGVVDVADLATATGDKIYFRMGGLDNNQANAGNETGSIVAQVR